MRGQAHCGGNGMYIVKRRYIHRVPVSIMPLIIVLFLSAGRIHAQISITNPYLNPFVAELTILATMLRTLSSPFSAYTENQYSSYNPFSVPYTTIPSDPDYNWLPYPLRLNTPQNIPSLFPSYDVYNPAAFLRSGYPDLSGTTSAAFSPFFSPLLWAAPIPFIPPVFPSPFPLF